MKFELEEEFQQKYPQIFQDLWGDPRETCMSFGISCGEGWKGIIDKLCADIMTLDPGPDFKAAQVKEKFGGLRFYVSGWPEDEEKSTAISKLIHDAETESIKTCEHCGCTENVKLAGSWIQALCDNCRGKKREVEESLVAEYMAYRDKIQEKRIAWLKRKGRFDGTVHPTTG